MVRSATAARILCVVGLMLCAGRGGRAGGVPLVISEFRFSGPSGATDEYIEIYNPGSAHTVAAASGIGYGIAASDGITRCTIYNGTVIPAQGHFLCVNSSGYSLGSYPSGYGTTATGDASYTRDIPDNAGIALFNNNIGGVSYSLGNRIDAVGSTSEPNPIYREGSGYAPITVAGPGESAWVRTTYGSCATGDCTPQSVIVWTAELFDSDDNARDFYYTGTSGGDAIQRLGAPGPQNLGAPSSTGSGDRFTPSRVSRCSSSDMPPNRVRDLTPSPNAPLGTLDLRVKWTNDTSVTITRLRFRVVDLTTAPAPPGTADLRVMSAGAATFTVDNYPCGTSDGGDIATGTILEQPPAQPDGGGFNSSLFVAPGGPSVIPAHGSINVRVRLGVVQNGFTRFCMVPETTPSVFIAFPFCYIGSTETLAGLPAPGDHDSDRIAEMAMYNPAYDALTARWTIRQSFGGFTTENVVRFASPERGATPVPGDYDGDGRIDPAIYQRSTGNWIVANSRFNSYFNFITTHGGPEWEAVPGDYDGDGTTDFAVASATFQIWRFWPSSAPSSIVVERGLPGPGLTPIGGQDFDGDGLCDMVVYNNNTGIWTYRPSSSNFDSTVSQFWGGSGFTLVPGDYDGDRRADYAVYHRATGTWWVLLSGGGLTTPSAPPYTTGFNGNWGGPGFVPVPADYDGDGRTDFGVYQAGTTRWLALTSSTSYSTSTPLLVTFGTIDDRPISSAVLPAVSREIRAGDADGDGLSDITAYNTTTGIWSTLRSSDGFMTPPMIGSRGGTGYTAVPGDYDGDGRRDLGVYENSTGQWIMLRSDGTPTPYMFSAGGTGWVPVAGDYDGDGRADMIVYNTTTGQWYGGKSRDNFVGAALIGFTWGGTGYTAAPGDFDGDGRLDISVYHEATGTWWILTSTSGYASGITRYYGGPGHRPVPADFDGDGITDFAVYNPTTEYWSILRSDTGNTVGFSRRYGGAAFTPVAGDWDGDRRADIAVYNADGNWSIVLSGTGYRDSLPATLGGAGHVPLPRFQ